MTSFQHFEEVWAALGRLYGSITCLEESQVRHAEQISNNAEQIKSNAEQIKQLAQQVAQGTESIDRLASMVATVSGNIAQLAT